MPKAKKTVALDPIDFWVGFAESGAAARCLDQIKDLAKRMGSNPSEAQVEGIFLACLSGSQTTEILTRKALEQLTAVNWSKLAK
jgi:hypothetical protein